MPQVDTKSQANTSKQRLAGIAIAVALVVVIVGIVLAVKFYNSTPKVTTTVALDNADELRSSGKTSDAIKVLQRQLGEASTTTDRLSVTLAIGAAYEGEHDYKHALEYYQKGAKIQSGYGTNAAIARAADHLGDKAMAIEYYKKNKALILSGASKQRAGELPEIEETLKRLGAQ